MTTASLAAGLTAAFFASFGERWALIGAALFLHAGYVLDSCDGDLARLTGQSSTFGKWYDVFSDAFAEQMLWIGLLIGAARNGLSDYAGWAWAAAAAGSLLNLFLLLRERVMGCSFHVAEESDPERRDSLFFQFLESLAHNGASILFVWIAALFMDARQFLFCGATFIWILGIVRFSANAKRLFPEFPFKAVFEILGTICGVWLLWLVFRDVSWSGLKDIYKEAGAGIALSLVGFPLWSIFFALGLKRLFPEADRKRISFGRLYRINLFCDAVNKITPFLDVGGEPLKVMLADRQKMASLEDCATAVFMARVIFIFSEAAAILAALGVAALLYPDASFFQIGAAGIVGSLIFGSVVLGSQKGLRKLIPMREAWVGRKRNLAIAFGWNTLGWITMFVEIYFAMLFFKKPLGAAGAFIVQSLLQAVKTLSFFIPANLGAQEHGMEHLLAMLGYPAAHGLALSLIIRFRQFFWAGLAAMFFFRAWPHRKSAELRRAV